MRVERKQHILSTTSRRHRKRCLKFLFLAVSRAGFTYGQDWAVAQGPPQPGGLHIFHGKKL